MHSIMPFAHWHCCRLPDPAEQPQHWCNDQIGEGEQAESLTLLSCCWPFVQTANRFIPLGMPLPEPLLIAFKVSSNLALCITVTFVCLCSQHCRVCGIYLLQLWPLTAVNTPAQHCCLLLDDRETPFMERHELPANVTYNQHSMLS